MKARDILARLRDYQPLTLNTRGSRPAAVLVLLRPRAHNPEDLEVVLTRRSEDLPSHAGQVAFPGGSKEPEDPNEVATALRETHEELGIHPQEVEVVGRLDDMVTITQFHVAQIVGVISRKVEIIPDPGEVARVFSVPMEVILNEAAWELRSHAFGGKDVQVWHLPYDGEDVWGATAYMLRGFVELLRR